MAYAIIPPNQRHRFLRFVGCLPPLLRTYLLISPALSTEPCLRPIRCGLYGLLHGSLRRLPLLLCRQLLLLRRLPPLGNVPAHRLLRPRLVLRQARPRPWLRPRRPTQRRRFAAQKVRVLRPRRRAQPGPIQGPELVPQPEPHSENRRPRGRTGIRHLQVFIDKYRNKLGIQFS